MKIQWDPIITDSSEQTSRLKVPGGWLIKEITYKFTEDNINIITTSCSICFLPDENHSWLKDLDM